MERPGGLVSGCGNVKFDRTTPRIPVGGGAHFEVEGPDDLPAGRATLANPKTRLAVSVLVA